MKLRMWAAVDFIAHFLYQPALMGRRVAVVPEWAQGIHLIPGAWVERMCTAYDRRLDENEKP